jgi:hypothetical protein
MSARFEDLPVNLGEAEVQALAIYWLRLHLSPASTSILDLANAELPADAFRDLCLRAVANEAMLHALRATLDKPRAADALLTTMPRLQALLTELDMDQPSTPVTPETLTDAALCYAAASPVPTHWPPSWPLTFWAPAEKSANLITAAALLLMAAEQLDEGSAEE